VLIAQFLLLLVMIRLPPPWHDGLDHDEAVARGQDVNTRNFDPAPKRINVICGNSEWINL
jgi:hypothetical protein